MNPPSFLGQVSLAISVVYKKTKNALSRILADDLDYFFEQFMYGHREIVIAHIRTKISNFSTQNMLRAGLSHGWQPDRGHWKLWNRNLTRARRLVWNDRLALASLSDARNLACGAPWIYLLDIFGIAPNMRVRHEQSNPLRPNLLMLTHNVVTTDKRIDLQAAHYDRLCGGNKTTVCLFWLDFCNPKIYEAFAKKGFNIVCAGYPQPFDISIQTLGRPEFLVNLLEIMTKHENYFTDECTTSLFYAASLGLNVKLSVDDIAREFQFDWTQKYSADGDLFFNSGNDWLNHFFPQLLDNSHETGALNEMAWRELGYREMKSVDAANFEWKIDSRIASSLVTGLEAAIEKLRPSLIFTKMLNE